MKRQSRPLPRPERSRAIEKPFAWIPCRLLTGGTLAQMSRNARQLYLLLALAADRRGLSFYGDARIQEILGFSAAEIEAARAELIDRDLLACHGRDYQLLSLPARPVHLVSRTSRAPTRNPAANPPTPHSPKAPSRETDSAQRSSMPLEVREELRRIFGRDAF